MGLGQFADLEGEGGGRAALTRKLSLRGSVFEWGVNTLMRTMYNLALKLK